MSMTACAICGGTIDCSIGGGRGGWYACDSCGAPIHYDCDCDEELKPGDECICPNCRGELQERRIIDEQYANEE